MVEYEAVVIGVSAGGMRALSEILPHLSSTFPLPVMIVQHRLAQKNNYFEELLDSKCSLKVKQAQSNQKIKAGNIYIAPGNYHLLVENQRELSLSVDPRVNYSRPSIDVLFESAIKTAGADHILKLKNIGPFLNNIFEFKDTV